MHFHIVKMYKDKEVNKNVKSIFFSNLEHRLLSVQMTSLQSQYLLRPPLACSTARIRLGTDSINRRIQSCGILPILAQTSAAVLVELPALVYDCARVDLSHPQMFYWVQI